MVHHITFTIYYRIFLRSNMTPKGYKHFSLYTKACSGPLLQLNHAKFCTHLQSVTLLSWEHSALSWVNHSGWKGCENTYNFFSVHHSFDLRTLSTQLSKWQWLKRLWKYLKPFSVHHTFELSSLTTKLSKAQKWKGLWNMLWKGVFSVNFCYVLFHGSIQKVCIVSKCLSSVFNSPKKRTRELKFLP